MWGVIMDWTELNICYKLILYSTGEWIIVYSCHLKRDPGPYKIMTFFKNIPLESLLPHHLQKMLGHSIILSLMDKHVRQKKKKTKENVAKTLRWNNSSQKSGSIFFSPNLIDLFIVTQASLWNFYPRGVINSPKRNGKFNLPRTSQG